MKIAHSSLKTSPNILYFIQKLIISDPLYKKGISCRYENNDLKMRSLKCIIKTDHIMDDDELEYTRTELFIMMKNDQYGNGILEKKEYNIGVDSAKYEIITNYNSELINTNSDGSWGDIIEYYYDNELSGIMINLNMTDDIMTEKEFTSAVLSTFNLSNLNFSEVQVKDLYMELNDGNKGMEADLKSFF